mmetsp:Transcript_2515/g.6935  ORF Transcript_2515/g.6935 Transcript_2515/m.6935 type:complete len:206 (-) Transcript_2515:366-983(-)
MTFVIPSIFFLSLWTSSFSPARSRSKSSSRNFSPSISFSYLSRREEFTTSSSASRFFFARFVMFMARDAKLRVPLVCSRCHPPPGDMVQIMAVLLLPPIACWSSLVSLESLYGMWPADLSASLDTTLPRQSKDWLMEQLSFMPKPEVFVSCTLSDPARSTRFRQDNCSILDPSWRLSRVNRTMRWDLEDLSFTFVLAVIRLSLAV